MSNFKEDKLKIVFVNNFFKTKYFRELKLNKFQIKNYDYHQLCFIFKLSPETILYAIDIFSTMDNFNNSKLYNFFRVRYKEVLRETFNEIQLYFFYAIKLLDFPDILLEEKNTVLQSNNQILISYYLKDGIFESEDIDVLKTSNDEKYWFQNYHLILYSSDLMNDIENSIDKYLIPVKATTSQKISYIAFYKDNLLLNNSIVRDIPDVQAEIEEYLRLKIAESEADFEEDEADEEDGD